MSIEKQQPAQEPRQEPRDPDETQVLLVTVVESKFSEAALAAATAAGAAGCSVLHGRGRHAGRTESIFNVPLDASLDMVLTVVRREQAGQVQDSIFKEVGLKTEAHGFVYQLPVSALYGLNPGPAGNGASAKNQIPAGNGSPATNGDPDAYAGRERGGVS